MARVACVVGGGGACGEVGGVQRPRQGAARHPCHPATSPEAATSTSMKLKSEIPRAPTSLGLAVFLAPLGYRFGYSHTGSASRGMPPAITCAGYTRVFRFDF